MISPHLGDLDSPRGLDLLKSHSRALQRLHGVRAGTLFCDAHRGYTGTRWALAQPQLPVLRDPAPPRPCRRRCRRIPREPRWLCFAWDGVGLGEDGTLWGGEALLGRPGAGTCRNLPAVRAARRRASRPRALALRAALAWELGLDWAPAGIDVALRRRPGGSGLNCPTTSSAGRLFDAAAAFLDCWTSASLEGEGPMALEADHGRAAAGRRRRVAFATPHRRAAACGLGAAGAFAARRGALAGAAVPRLSRPLAPRCSPRRVALRQAHGPFAVGSCGGVFQNRLLSERGPASPWRRPASAPTSP